MSAPFLPPADTDHLFRCTFTVYDEHNRPRFCGRRCVAVYEGPLGRLPRCSVHERVVKRSDEYRVVSRDPHIESGL